MWVGIREIGRLAWIRWPGVAAVGGLSGALWMLGFRMQARAGHRRRERRVEEELEAYARLEVWVPADGNAVELAGRVSRLVAEKSAFRRAAMLVRNVEGRLSVAASTGMDESVVQSLNAWGEGVMAAEGRGGDDVRRGEGGLGVRVGARSFVVILGRGLAEIGYQRAIVIPLRTTEGRVLGALAVGADGLLSVRQSSLAKALVPLEALAFKVEREMENAAMVERLVRAEKLAGLGVMAGGMAHALNNPLTAVLGFAELIVGSTGEARVKEDAGIIVREALRMRQTVETLLEFWRPAAQSDELMDVTDMVRALAGACKEMLESRGVRLVVQCGDEAVVVRGNRLRLRQMMEHLLNNAAQALASVGAVKSDEELVIRLSMCRAGRTVHLVVSDAGPGFREPGRVFELCDSMRRPEGGARLGLSVCYGIVQEHGGEISAFNLHPHGAAVAVELPVAGFANKKSGVGVGERVIA